MYERHCSIFRVRISTLIPTCTHGLETPFIGEAYSSLSNSSSWILVMNQPIPLPSLPVCLSLTHTQTHATITIPREVRKFQARLHPVNSSSTVGDCSLILSSALRPLPLSRFSPGAAQTLSPLLYPPHHLSWCCVFCPESDAHHNVDTPFPESALPLRGQDPMHALSDGPEQWCEGPEGFPSSFSPTRVPPGPEPALGPVRTSLLMGTHS